MTQPEITTYGLIGNPISKSLSPLMHNTAFRELNVDAVYKLFPLEENQLDDFFSQLRKKGNPIFGLNITVPYKEKVIKYLDDLSLFADKVKAVNTIVISNDRKLKGFNTDGPGFLTHLSELNFDVQDKRIAIIGAGGATRAIVSVLCLMPKRPSSIKIYDIEQGKTEKLISDLEARIDVSIVKDAKAIDDLNIEIADLLINATPIGMKKGDPCLIDEECIHANMLVYDVIYNPLETKLLAIAKKKGAQVSNGLGMLFFQGVLAFQHWADIELEAEIKAKMCESLLKGAGVW